MHKLLALISTFSLGVHALLADTHPTMAEGDITEGGTTWTSFVTPPDQIRKGGYNGEDPPPRPLPVCTQRAIAHRDGDDDFFIYDHNIGQNRCYQQDALDEFSFNEPPKFGSYANFGLGLIGGAPWMDGLIAGMPDPGEARHPIHPSIHPRSSAEYGC